MWTPFWDVMGTSPGFLSDACKATWGGGTSIPYFLTFFRITFCSCASAFVSVSAIASPLAFLFYFLCDFFSSVFPFLSLFPLKLILYSVASKVAHFSNNVFFFFYFFCMLWRLYSCCLINFPCFLCVYSLYFCDLGVMVLILFCVFCFSEQTAPLIEFLHLHITCVICLFLCAIVSLFITRMQFCLQWLGKHQKDVCKGKLVWSSCLNLVQLT